MSDFSLCEDDICLPQYSDIIDVGHLVVVLPHEEPLHPHHLPVLHVLRRPAAPARPRPGVGAGHHEAGLDGALVYVKTTFAYLSGVELLLFIVQAVLGCQDVERIEDTPATHVLTRSEIHLT